MMIALGNPSASEFHATTSSHEDKRHSGKRVSEDPATLLVKSTFGRGRWLQCTSTMIVFG